MRGGRKRAGRIGLAVAVVGAMLAVGAGSGVADAEDRAVCLVRLQMATAGCPARPEMRFDAQALPRRLPSEARAPVSMRVHGSISTADGSLPSSLRRVEMDFDRAGAIDARGLPVCSRSKVETLSIGPLRRACRSSIVGRGTALVGIPSAEPVPLDLTVFNGGVRGGATTLFIRASGALSTPSPVLVTVRPIGPGAGPYGLRAVAEIPPLDLSGSLIDFELVVGRRFADRGVARSYLSASCPDGALQIGAREDFRDGTILAAAAVRSCAAAP